MYENFIFFQVNQSTPQCLDVLECLDFVQSSLNFNSA